MLTASQIEAFKRDGFLVVEDVITDILPQIHAEYNALMDGVWADWGLDHEASSFEDRIIAGYRAGLEYFQPMDISLPLENITPDVPFHAGPAVFAMMTHKEVLDIIEGLIGPEITSCPIQHVRIKPPASDMREDEVRAHIAATDWHQDRGVTQEIADQTDMVTCWIAVSDATVENGCLQAVRGAHSDGLLPHCPQPQVGIPGEHIDRQDVVPLPVKAGGLVLFHPMTPHASLDNTTDGIRWSFDLRYTRSGQPTGRDQFPSFIARSHKSPESELRNARAWRELWLDARSRLSVNPVQEFYRWDENAPYCA